MKKNLILLTVACVMFMEAVDTTILNTAIPAMSRSLAVNPLDLKIALISYLISLAIFIPISGWLADKFGIKTVFISAVIIFTVSSVWCGFAYGVWQLVIARIIQGLGGSLTVPVGRLIIIRTCERHELITKMTIVVMVASLGMMLGPVLGGVITEYFSWRWVFWVNAPVGLLTLVLSYYLLPILPGRHVHALDKLGFVLFGSGLAMLTLGLSLLSESNLSHIFASLMIIIASGLLLLYTWHSRHKEHPIVNINLLKIRTFRVSVLGNLMARLGFGGMPFLLPLLLQIILNFSPQKSGLLIAPIAFGVLLVKPFSIYVLRFLGYKKLLIANTFLVCLSLLSFTSIQPTTCVYFIALLTFVYGFLIAMQYTAMNSLAYANIMSNEMSAATSIMSTTQQLAQSFGVAAAALMISFFSWEDGRRTDFTIHAFHQTFVLLALLTFLATIIFISLKKDDGHELLAKPS